MRATAFCPSREVLKWQYNTLTSSLLLTIAFRWRSLVAGPVGLMMANYLGKMGIDVLVVEKLDKLIDYPRAIGIDDEALRTMQSVGLVDNVLPHTTPWHAMRFLTPKGRCFADIQPMTDEFITAP